MHLSRFDECSSSGPERDANYRIHRPRITVTIEVGAVARDELEERAPDR